MSYLPTNDSYLCNPKITSSLYEATNTLPFATTGTRFGFVPLATHAPAFPKNSCFKVDPPESGEKAYKDTVVRLRTGRVTAQIIGFAPVPVPFDETLVKKPFALVVRSPDAATRVSAGAGEVASFHTSI